MKQVVSLFLFAFLTIAGADERLRTESNQELRDILVADSTRCCKVCKKGKACGDSCISKSKQCHKGKGCACNAK